MRANPLVSEVLAGLSRRGQAQLDYLGLLLVQAMVLLLWWPKSGVTQILESQRGPNTLAAVLVAVGLAMAYFALRAGAEEVMLPGQRGLRDWALALGPGRILSGYLAGQVIHSLHLLALSSPLLLMAFTVSGGEWSALGWCVAALLVQALFYRLCGAITHLSVGQHGKMSFFSVRALLLLFYVPVGLLAPVASHVAFSYRALAEDAATEATLAATPQPVAFLVTYAALSVLAGIALHRLLARAHGGTSDPRGGAGAGEALRA